MSVSEKLRSFRYATSVHELPWKAVRGIDVAALRHEAPDLRLMKNMLSMLCSFSVSGELIRSATDADLLQLFHIMQASLQFAIWSQQTLKEVLVSTQAENAAKRVTSSYVDNMEAKVKLLTRDLEAVQAERDTLSLASVSLHQSLAKCEATIKMLERQLTSERERSSGLIKSMEQCALQGITSGAAAHRQGDVNALPVPYSRDTHTWETDEKGRPCCPLCAQPHAHKKRRRRTHSTTEYVDSEPSRSSGSASAAEDSMKSFLAKISRKQKKREGAQMDTNMDNNGYVDWETFAHYLLRQREPAAAAAAAAPPSPSPRPKQHEVADGLIHSPISPTSPLGGVVPSSERLKGWQGVGNMSGSLAKDARSACEKFTVATQQLSTKSPPGAHGDGPQIRSIVSTAIEAFEEDFQEQLSSMLKTVEGSVVNVAKEVAQLRADYVEQTSSIEHQVQKAVEVYAERISKPAVAPRAEGDLQVPKQHSPKNPPPPPPRRNSAAELKSTVEAPKSATEAAASVLPAAIGASHSSISSPKQLLPSVDAQKTSTSINETSLKVSAKASAASSSPVINIPSSTRPSIKLNDSKTGFASDSGLHTPIELVMKQPTVDVKKESTGINEANLKAPVKASGPSSPVHDVPSITRPTIKLNDSKTGFASDSDLNAHFELVEKQPAVAPAPAEEVKKEDANKKAEREATNIVSTPKPKSRVFKIPIDEGSGLNNSLTGFGDSYTSQPPPPAAAAADDDRNKTASARSDNTLPIHNRSENNSASARRTPPSLSSGSLSRSRTPLPSFSVDCLRTPPKDAKKKSLDSTVTPAGGSVAKAETRKAPGSAKASASASKRPSKVLHPNDSFSSVTNRYGDTPAEDKPASAALRAALGSTNTSVNQLGDTPAEEKPASAALRAALGSLNSSSVNRFGDMPAEDKPASAALRAALGSPNTSVNRFGDTPAEEKPASAALRAALGSLEASVSQFGDTPAEDMPASAALRAALGSLNSSSVNQFGDTPAEEKPASAALRAALGSPNTSVNQFGDTPAEEKPASAALRAALASTNTSVNRYADDNNSSRVGSPTTPPIYPIKDDDHEVPCTHCRQRFPFGQHSSHEAACDMKMVKCKQCGQSIVSRMLPRHKCGQPALNASQSSMQSSQGSERASSRLLREAQKELQALMEEEASRMASPLLQDSSK